MPKIAHRPLSRHARAALTLMGQSIREARISRAMTAAELAERAGMSRALLQRIERGDAGCSIGAVFEAAVICGLPLFEPDLDALNREVWRRQEKLALMPKSVHAPKRKIHDDF
jgi:transcriptional regulator with XRE-family HTH domain